MLEAALLDKARHTLVLGPGGKCYTARQLLETLAIQWDLCANEEHRARMQFMADSILATVAGAEPARRGRAA